MLYRFDGQTKRKHGTGRIPPGPPRRFPALVLLAGLAAGCATANGGGAALLLPNPTRRVAVAALIDEMPTANENIVRRQISDGESTTAFLVRIADREEPHRHTRYDLTVVVVDGSGTLWLDGVPLAMNAGDTAYIPRGHPHQFVNTGNGPATAVAVFSPRFAGPDNEPVAAAKEGNPQGEPRPNPATKGGFGRP